jgi:hypothetical protein
LGGGGAAENPHLQDKLLLAIAAKKLCFLFYL